MITFKFVRFTSVAYVSHTVNVLVTDIILNIKSQDDLTFPDEELFSETAVGCTASYFVKII